MTKQQVLSLALSGLRAKNNMAAKSILAKIRAVPAWRQACTLENETKSAVRDTFRFIVDTIQAKDAIEVRE